MEIENNPYIQPEDYFAGYRQKIEALKKNNPEILEFDKICYELFYQNTQGKRFLEIIQERYLIPGLVGRDSPNYPYMAIWADGFKDAFRMLLNSVNAHEQRIKHGDK